MKSIYMDNRWAMLQQEKEKGNASIYVFEKDGRKVVYPFIKRAAGTVDGVQYFDLVTPRGEAGIRFENCRTEDLAKIAAAFDEAFAKYCAEEKIVAEFIRFSPWHDHYAGLTEVYDLNFHGNVYCNNLTCDFFMEEYPSNERQKIRKAERMGMEVQFGNDESFIENFLNLYCYTEERFDACDYYRLDKAFVGKCIAMFPDEMLFAQANLDGKAVSSTMFFLGPDIAHGIFCGTDQQYRNTNANKVTMYHAALYASEQGKKLFDWGGAKQGSPVEMFKKRCTKEFPYYRGTKIRDEAIYAKLVEQAGGPRENFFPAYRKG
ncbi:acetyltransferase (GNAT) family protein [Trichococcus patagoniensis]|uniref:Acetyltransferase (GNAT) family protein n=1 Tax=Trichococcus patagoniensis TaxID=382641 RepID=A0A2T5IQB2_9LACT|nr:peptidoglycan bridge formation glycyltransferase FemA/FemB family protein [Trichococcus patagoniensis]PTQ86014.1 acetyltransferase (GNAT) family protein [Trichococcus patagoniensis]